MWELLLDQFWILKSQFLKLLIFWDIGPKSLGGLFCKTPGSIYWYSYNPANTAICVIIPLTCFNFSDVVICSYITFSWLIKNFFSINHNAIILILLSEDNIILYVLFYCSHFQTIKQEFYLLLETWKLGSIKKSKYLFFLSVETLDWYLFQLIVLLKPSFNCPSFFALSWVDKVTIGT